MTQPDHVSEIERELRSRFPDGPIAAPTSVAIVTQRGTSPDATVTAVTPSDQPNVTVQPITIAKRITIRAVKTYLQSLVGFLLTAGFTGSVAPNVAPVPLQTFTDVALTAAVAALVPAAMSALTNLLILFTRLDESNPSVMA